MPSKSRQQDLGVGICCCHPPVPCIPMTGFVLTYSFNTLVNSLGAGRLTDIVIGYCGHTGIMITSSNKTFINGLGSIRIGDRFAGCFTGSIITGSGNTITG